MIEDMYSIMARINEIRSRFGINRTSESTGESGGGISFDRMTDQAISSMNKASGIDDNADFSKGDIDKIISYYSAKNRIPASLVRSVVKAESDYNPDAVSPKGAMGLMQLMPDTVMGLGVENPFNPEENIKGGVSHLKSLIDNNNGDYRLALAAYNAGQGRVDKAGGIPDIRETKEYIDRVIELYKKEGGR